MSDWGGPSGKKSRNKEKPKKYEDGQRPDELFRKAEGGGQKERACFPAGVKILTPKGLIPINLMSEGDMVLSWSESENCLVAAKVIRVQSLPPSAVSELDFADKTGLRATSSHSLATDKGWQAVRSLRIGSIVHSVDGPRSVLNMRINVSVEPVYNLITERQFSFVADGIIAHNFTRMRALRCAYWTSRLKLEHECRSVRRAVVSAACSVQRLLSSSP